MCSAYGLWKKPDISAVCFGEKQSFVNKIERLNTTPTVRAICTFAVCFSVLQPCSASNVNNCYTFHDVDSTWNEARDACQDMGAHLVTMETIDE